MDAVESESESETAPMSDTQEEGPETEWETAPMDAAESESEVALVENWRVENKSGTPPVNAVESESEAFLGKSHRHGRELGAVIAESQLVESELTTPDVSSQVLTPAYSHYDPPSKRNSRHTSEDGMDWRNLRLRQRNNYSNRLRKDGT
jgi:hypothetical protein